MRFKYLILLYLVLLPAMLSAQTLSYTQYSIKDGLAGNQVYSICQDHQGFLWFGTETGVSRYDGTRFRNYTIKDGLPDNAIIKVFPDSRGRVWLVPFNKSICYFFNGKLYNQQNDPILRTLNFNNSIFNISETDSGSIVFLSLTDLYELPKEEQYPNNFLAIENLLPSIYPRLKTPIMTRYGYNLYSQIWGKITIQPSTRSGETHIKYYSREFEYWVVGAMKLLYVRSKKRNSDYLFQFPDINTVSNLNDSTIAVNTANGTFILNVNQQRIINHVMPGLNIGDFFIDTEGNSWLAVIPGGLIRVHSDQFKCIDSGPSGERLSVSSFFKTRNSILVGTKNKVLELSSNLQLNTFYQSEDIARPINQIEHYDGKYYFGGGALLISGNRQLGFKKTHVYSAIKRFAFTKEKRPVAATAIALTEILEPARSKVRVLSEGRKTAVFIQNDTCWIGTPHGLYRMVQDLVYTWVGNMAPQLQDRISFIKGDSLRRIWVATAGKGILALQNNRVVYQFSNREGLSSDAAHCIEPDEDGSVWVGTDKGIDHITFESGGPKISTSLTSDGIMSGFINAITIRGDTVFAGTPEGIVFFNKKNMAIHSSCKLVILDIVSSGNKLNNQQIPDMKYGSGNVTVHYTAISFKSAGNITYHYRLNGLDTAWQQTELQSLEFISLPPGSYELELYATNRFNVKSETIRLQWVVYPLFWQKEWFVILVLLLAVLLTRYLVKRKNKKELSKKEHERSIRLHIQQLEQKAMLAQMNPHFIFNSMHAVQEFILDKDIISANRYLNSFARLIRQTLDQSLRSVLSLAEEMEYLETYLKLEQLRFSQQFDYSFIVHKSIDVHHTFIPCMLLQPIVENAIGHGIQNRQQGGGKIEIEFKVSDRLLICSIRDNGPGFSKVQELKTVHHIEYQSRGMQLTRQRIELLGKSLSCSTSLAARDIVTHEIIAGTEIILQLPLITDPNFAQT